jgi:HK97 family phage prohead protease
LPIARTKSGTMNLAEDNVGLHVEANLSKEDPDVANVARKMQRGDISEMSFAFKAVDQEWSSDFSKRVILAAELTGGDVSIVNSGANPATTSSIRADSLTFEQRRCRPRN